MFLDAYNRYSNAQALTATANSTNVIDHGSDRNIGIGNPMALFVQVGVAADQTDGDETYTVKLVTDDNEALSSATDVTPAYTIPRGTAAGTTYVIPIPPNTVIERYTAVTYTLGGTTPTITVSSFLLPLNMAQNFPNVFYPDAITID